LRKGSSSDGWVTQPAPSGKTIRMAGIVYRSGLHVHPFACSLRAARLTVVRGFVYLRLTAGPTEETT
jgi:hypothetical protein